MRGPLLLLPLVALSSAVLFDEYKLSDASIQIVAASTSQAALSPCNDITWNACQTSFNKAVGIDSTLGYRTGSKFFNATNALLNDINSILKVCQARTMFYQCLGSSYYPCMNLFNILAKPGEGYQDAFDYSRSFLGMEFMCTAGFETVTTDWGCLQGIQTTKSYRDCLNGFNELLPPDQLCPNVDTVGQCLYTAYTNVCADKGAGFYGCENFRVTFDQSCYGLRCNVV